MGENSFQDGKFFFFLQTHEEEENVKKAEGLREEYKTKLCCLSC